MHQLKVVPSNARDEPRNELLQQENGHLEGMQTGAQFSSLRYLHVLDPRSQLCLWERTFSQANDVNAHQAFCNFPFHL